MSHEMGHPAGLGDCPGAECQNNTTMSLPASMPGPTACDVNYIVYYGAFLGKKAPGSGSGGGSGCGYSTETFYYDEWVGSCDIEYEEIDSYYCGQVQSVQTLQIGENCIG